MQLRGFCACNDSRASRIEAHHTTSERERQLRDRETHVRWKISKSRMREGTWQTHTYTLRERAQHRHNEQQESRLASIGLKRALMRHVIDIKPAFN